MLVLQIKLIRLLINAHHHMHGCIGAKKPNLRISQDDTKPDCHVRNGLRRRRNHLMLHQPHLTSRCPPHAQTRIIIIDGNVLVGRNSTRQHGILRQIRHNQRHWPINGTDKNLYQFLNALPQIALPLSLEHIQIGIKCGIHQKITRRFDFRKQRRMREEVQRHRIALRHLILIFRIVFLE